MVPTASPGMGHDALTGCPFAVCIDVLAGKARIMLTGESLHQGGPGFALFLQAENWNSLDTSGCQGRHRDYTTTRSLLLEAAFRHGRIKSCPDKKSHSDV